MPEIKGKFDGIAFRCHAALGSIADMVFNTSKKVSVDELKILLRKKLHKAGTEEYLGLSRMNLYHPILQVTHVVPFSTLP